MPRDVIRACPVTARRAPPEHERMTSTCEIHIDVEALDALFDEIQAYLAAVDAFRREGREPSWQAEPEVLR